MENSGQKKQDEKKSLGEAKVLKLLEDREDRLELERLCQKEEEMGRRPMAS